MDSNQTWKLNRNKRLPKNAKVNWAKWDEYLGKWTDTKLAAKAGCAPQTVRVRRVKRKIPAATKKIDWDKYDNLIGTMTDSELATQIGCSKNTVYYRRLVLGK